MTVRAYPAYQESEVEWIGLLPHSWTVGRVKYVTRSIEQGWSPQCDGFPVSSSEEWGVLKVGCVNGGRFNPEENKALPIELKPVPELGIVAGDVLVSRANTRELVGGAVCVSSNYSNLLLCDKLYRLRINDEICLPQWLAVWLRSDAARGQIELAASGASQSMVNIGQSTILDLPIPLPILDEQIQILGFLDRETGKVDALVTEQERLIALLKEKRQAIISHAVTKGLNPTAPMKDSGVPWLGEVPAHWGISPVKHLASHVVDCLHTTPTYDGDQRFPAIRTADVERGKLNLTNARLVSFEVYNDRIQRLQPKAGDVLYTREGERFGLAALVPSGVDLCLGQRMMMFRANSSCDPAYLMWMLNSTSIYEQVVSGITGSTAPHVNIGEVINFLAPQPTISEQVQIVSYIKKSTTRIDTLIEESSRAITLLRERRAALISAAVTGKTDVRDTVAQPSSRAA